MTIKDRITRWFIQSVIIPNEEDIQNPGYIISKFSSKNKKIALREFFFPEKFYYTFESNIAKELGREGEQRLYSIGKKFGYRYAVISRYENIGSVQQKGVADFMYLFTRYLEVVYAKNLEHKIEFGKKQNEVIADSYVGCEKNGLGYLLLIGAWTGGWAYIMADKTVEGIQLECQGRGDKLCKLVCAPLERIKKISKTCFSETNMNGLDEEYEKYEMLNKVYPTINKNLSLKSLIEVGIFKYNQGQLFLNQERMVGIEFSMYYLIDNEFSKDKKSRKILFESAFEVGKEIGTNKDQIFVQRFLSSIGFGDVQVVKENDKYKIRLYHFPYASLSKDCEFVLISGLASGLISGISKKDQILKMSSKVHAGDGLHVKLD